MAPLHDMAGVRQPGSPTGLADRSWRLERFDSDYAPFSHFLMKLVLAAPESGLPS